MSLRRTSVLLPCHSLEDFPAYLRGRPATSLLAAWSAIWHPSLIALTGEFPTWRRADDPPDPNALSGELVIVPEASQPMLPPGWLETFRSTHPSNPLPITDTSDRHSIIASLEQATIVDTDPVERATVQDFFSLGYCYLQIELLTRAMHYSGMANQAEFAQAVVAAAQTAMAADTAEIEAKLGHAFDLLIQARQHFYPVDSYLVDVTLVSEHTWGKPLRQELSDSLPTSILTTGTEIQRMAEREPDSIAAMQARLSSRNACMLGGHTGSRTLQALDPESLLDEFVKGRRIYEQFLGEPVSLFGQYHSDTSRLVPQVLASLGFEGALLTSFDGHSVPAGQQARCQWMAADGSSIDAVWATPLNSAIDETFLDIAETISRSMQHDHVATVVLAGWSGQRSPFYEDLRRSARFGPILGKFVTLEDYFHEAADTEYWAAMQVTVPRRSAALISELHSAADPISSAVAKYRRQVLNVHNTLLDGLAGAVGMNSSAAGVGPPAAAPLESLRQQVVDSQHEGGHEEGRLLVNAWSFPRQVLAGDSETPDYHASPEPVPGFGFRLVSNVASTERSMANDNRLFNEHVELVVSQKTGGIQSFRTYRDRRTRASQRLVFVDDARFERRSADSAAGTSRMELDEMEIVRNDAAAAAIKARGRLIGGDERLLARFSQLFTLPRGARHVLLDIALEGVEPFNSDHQRAYLASRLVWDSTAVNLRRGSNWLAEPVEQRQVLAADWIEVARADSGGTLTLYPWGLPRHERLGERALDSLLMVAGESGTRFRLALGLDDPYPLQTALGLLTPSADCGTKATHAGRATSGWFLHLSSKNVVATQLAPLEPPGHGLAMRLLETEGRAAEVRVSAWRQFTGGSVCDLCGRRQREVAADRGQLVVEMGPHEWLQIQGDLQG